MGKRGPSPKPTAIRLLEGNRGRLPINPNEPRPDPTMPDCPPWLDAEARAEWALVTPQLKAMGVLTRIDRAILTGYCATWSRWKAVYLTLRELGTTFETPQGFLANRPEVIQERNLLALLRFYASEFGMTSAARSRVSANAKPEDGLDQLLS